MNLGRLLLYAEIGMKTNLETNQKIFESTKCDSFLKTSNLKIEEDLKVLHQMLRDIDDKKPTSEILERLEPMK